MVGWVLVLVLAWRDMGVGLRLGWRGDGREERHDSHAFRRRRMEVQSSMQRMGEQMRWKDLEKRREGERSASVRRSLGVVYSKARFSAES